MSYENCQCPEHFRLHGTHHEMCSAFASPPAEPRFAVGTRVRGAHVPALRGEIVAVHDDGQFDVRWYEGSSGPMDVCQRRCGDARDFVLDVPPTPEPLRVGDRVRHVNGGVGVIVVAAATPPAGGQAFVPVSWTTGHSAGEVVNAWVSNLTRLPAEPAAQGPCSECPSHHERCWRCAEPATVDVLNGAFKGRYGGRDLYGRAEPAAQRGNESAVDRSAADGEPPGPPRTTLPSTISDEAGRSAETSSPTGVGGRSQAGTPAPSGRADHPHECPRCGSPAYCPSFGPADCARGAACTGRAEVEIVVEHCAGLGRWTMNGCERFQEPHFIAYVRDADHIRCTAATEEAARAAVHRRLGGGE